MDSIIFDLFKSINMKKKRKTLTIKHTDLIALIIKEKDRLPDLLKDAFDFTEDEPGVLHYFYEPTCWDELNAACGDNFTIKFPDHTREEGFTITLGINPNTELMEITQMLKPIHAFTDWVCRSYEEETYPWEKNAWEEDYCSGDDDVDYNSSYIDCCIAMIELYLLRNGFTYHECTTYCQKKDFNYKPID